MSARHLFATLAIATCAAVACISPSSEEEAGLGVASAAVTNVPSDVGCIVISATGNRVAERRFDVVPGASSILPMHGLPVGSVVFRGDAYSTACSAVTSSSSPTWVSDPVSATLTAGVDVPVKLPLRRNGTSSVSVDFEDGPDAGAPDAPVDAPLDPPDAPHDAPPDAPHDAPPDAPPVALLAGSATTLSFPATRIGASSATLAFTLTNVGSAPSGVITPAFAGGDTGSFVISSNTCASLAPAASCTVSIAFSPTARGARSATLNFSASPGGTVGLALYGTGLTPAQLTISPPSRDFGSQTVTSPSSAFTFTVTNIGDLATGVPSLPLLGGADASEFQVAGNTCTSAIAPGASCTMAVRFAPASMGTKTATLSQNPAGGGGVSAMLTGTGSFF